MSNTKVHGVLECRGLSKKFNDGEHTVEVFSGIDFRVSEGEMIAITGASGAGKSSFLHVLGGLDHPSAGEVYMLGDPLSQLSEKQRSTMRNAHLGFVYQFHHLLPDFNALENVCMPLWIKGISKKQAQKIACEYIDRVGLLCRSTHRIGELSGGERQRIAIARALATKPACVLADEPTGNLDAGTAEKVFSMMVELNKELSTSFVVVTHNAELSMQLESQYHLADGKLTSLNKGNAV